MRHTLTTLLGKSVRQIAKLRGGGSALPGLVVERMDPGYMARTLGRLTYGVVVVSGTNGKTTTTKMIVEMLEAIGLRVFTNKTGSNFSRGVVAAAIAESTPSGRLEADIAVLELDEAHAMYFISRVAPKQTLLLNVLRDQLDRFGEIDTTAQYLQRIADATTGGLIVNRDDPLVAEIGERTRLRAESNGNRPEVREFGLSDDLRRMFPSDADFHSASNLPKVDARVREADVTLTEAGDHEAVFEIDGVAHRTPLKLEGLYNTFNAAAALATVRTVIAQSAYDDICPGCNHLETSSEQLIAALAEVRPAFGRGERLELDGQPLDLVLVKNPAGFRLALNSFAADEVATMIAINDQHADGRDMSWLWDVEFDSLTEHGVVMASGTRAWDMALRLEHDGVSVANVNSDLRAALTQFRKLTQGRPRRIFCTYTAMLALREQLSHLTDVEDIW